jgi:prepilin peptidase CpaA
MVTMNADSLISFTALAIASVACVTDVRSRRIPNALTFGAATLGLIAHASTGGIAGALTSFGGLALGLGLFLPFFLLGGMGAGDVKLLAALGAWVGLADVFWLAMYTSIIGGVLAVTVSLARGYLGTALRNIWTLIGFWKIAGPRAMPGLTLQDSPAPRLAYAVPIFLGTVVTLWLR